MISANVSLPDLQLSKKVQLNKQVQPIQLPSSAIKDKAKCRVAGWGFTKTRGTTVDVLKKVDVSIVPLKDCRRKWESHGVHLGNTVICAGGSDQNKGFCNVCFLFFPQKSSGL